MDESQHYVQLEKKEQVYIVLFNVYGIQEQTKLIGNRN